MGDYTVVYFKGIERGFSVPSILSDFSFFGLQLSVKWYGVIIALGFLAAVIFAGRMAYKWKMNLDKMIDVLIYATIFGIFGARLFYVIFQHESLSGIFKIWEGGLSLYGGIIGALLAAIAVCTIRKLNLYNLLDLLGMSFLLGQGIGRWGNFMSQDSFGTNTSLPWGMWSQKIATTIGEHQAEFTGKGFSVSAGTFAEKVYVHPTFLYESIWCFIGFGLIYLVCKKYRKFSGQLILCSAIWYGIGRTIIDSLRLDSGYLIGSSGIRVSQLFTGALVLASAAALIILLKKYKRNPKPIEGIDFFPEEENSKAKKTKPASKAEKSKEIPACDKETKTEEYPEDKIEVSSEKTEEMISNNDAPSDE